MKIRKRDLAKVLEKVTEATQPVAYQAMAAVVYGKQGKQSVKIVIMDYYV